MSLFKRPKSKINVRVTRNDSDDDESKSESMKPVDEGIDSLKTPQVLTGELKSDGGDVGNPIIPVENSVSSSSITKSTSQPLGEKKFDPKVKLKLSFGDDEEEEADVFQVKKSAYSRRIAKQMRREKKRKEKEEKLEEAKRSAKSSNSEQIFSFNLISKEDKKSEIETSDNTQSFKEPDIHLRDISSHQFKPLKEGQFPSAKEIYAARRKREEDRKKMKMENIIEDFISVEEETAAERIALGHMDDEQPVYEEENDNDDDDDVDDRIDFAVDREAIERERVKEAFIQAQEEDKDTYHRNRDTRDSDESEDEIDLWEKEQIRKGVGFSIGSTNRDQQPNNQLNDLMTKLDLPSTSDKSSSSSIPSYLPKNPNSKATEEHIQQLTDDICDAISQINREIIEDEQELKSIRAERQQLIVEVEELEEKLKESGLDDDLLGKLSSDWKKGQTFKPNQYDTSDDD